MSVINGKAKKFDGTAIDYVLLFDWASGKCLGKSVPNASGAWSFVYYTSPNATINIGITYVADGCEPITHGDYDFFGLPPTSGFLLLSYIDYRANGVPIKNELNPNLITEPTWTEYFSQTINVALIDSIFASRGTAVVNESAKTLDFFDINWNLSVRGYVSGYAEQAFTVEFIDVHNNVVFALKSNNIAPDRSGFWYGSSLKTLISNTSSDSRAFTSGLLTFTATSASFENTLGSDRGNPSFTFNADISSVVKLRFTASNSKSEDGDTGSWVRIVPQP